jgi:hypothetical protein
MLLHLLMGLEEGVKVDDVEEEDVIELVRVGIGMAVRSSAVGLLLYVCVAVVSMGLGVCMEGNEVEVRTVLDGDDKEEDGEVEVEVEDSA